MTLLTPRKYDTADGIKSIYPGDTEAQRKAWRNSWHKYLNKINYPSDLRKESNPDYVALRQMYIESRLSHLKSRAQAKANALVREKVLSHLPKEEKEEIVREIEIIREEEIKGKSGNISKKVSKKVPQKKTKVRKKKISHEKARSLATVAVPAGLGKAPLTYTQAVRQATAQLMFNPVPLKKDRTTVRSRKKFKPAPTGYHSPLSIYKWLPYYLPNHFRGDKAIKQAFSSLKKKSVFKTILASQQTPRSHKNQPPKKRPRLYFGQKRMLKWMMSNPWAAFEVFRSAGKTQLAIGLMVYLICENPNLRLFYLSEEQRKTIRRVRLVRSLLASEMIVNDYGYLIDDGVHGKSTESMFQCYRSIDAIEPTLMAITWRDAQALGYHFDGGILDDPWSQKLQNEFGAKKKWLEWWGEFRFCLEDAKFCWMLRTRKALHDLYEELDKKRLFAVYRQKLIIKAPSKVTFIENSRGVIEDVKFSNDYMIFDDCFGKYSMKNLLLLQKEDPYYFEREIQNNPYMIEGDVFKWKNARFYDAKSTDIIIKGFRDQVRTHGGGVTIIKMMDMSFGESEQSDFNVLLVLAKYKNRYFLMDAWVGRWNFDKRLKIIEKAEEKYPGVPLYIEEDFWQLAIIKDIRSKLPHLTIRGFQSKGKGQDFKSMYEGEKKAAKKGKIHDALAVPWNDRRVYIRKDITGLQMLQEQLSQFPNCTYFDYLDTLAMGVIVLRPKGGSVALFC